MDGRALFLGLAFALMWSSAFTSARIIVAYAPPLYSLSARFLISGLIGVIIALILGQSWRLSRKQWISVAVFGVCQNALYLGLNFVAMQTVEASLAAIIASTMPLIVACAGWIIFRERLSALGICGLIAGLIGVALIMGSRIQADVDLFGIALCVVGAVSLAAATLSMRGVSSSGNFLMIVGLQMLVGSLTLWVPCNDAGNANYRLDERLRICVYLYNACARAFGNACLVYFGGSNWCGARVNIPLS